MRPEARSAVTLVFVILLLGASSAKLLPEITSESDQNFHDLVFQLDAQTKNGNGERQLRCYGLYRGKRVGFDVALRPSWKAISLGSNLPKSYQGSVELRSLGPESDALVRAVDNVYGTRVSPKSMNASTLFAVISLEGSPEDLSLGPVKLKLFFESDDEERYAELFLNIDQAAGRVHLDEKDPDYRRPVVLALSRPRDGG
jgi:hypothetical protein